jgi:hypothetical protein
VIVRPETVIAWRRKKFREHWAKLSHSGNPGRPAVPKEVRDLIRRMSSANPLWGSPASPIPWNVLGDFPEDSLGLHRRYRLLHDIEFFQGTLRETLADGNSINATH